MFRNMPGIRACDLCGVTVLQTPVWNKPPLDSCVKWELHTTLWIKVMLRLNERSSETYQNWGLGLVWNERSSKTYWEWELKNFVERQLDTCVECETFRSQWRMRAFESSIESEHVREVAGWELNICVEWQIFRDRSRMRGWDWCGMTALHTTLWKYSSL